MGIQSAVQYAVVGHAAAALLNLELSAAVSVDGVLAYVLVE